jgi:hypothetical protein
MSQSQITTNASAATTAQNILSYELEITPIRSKKPYLKCIKDILALNPCMRATVAEMIRERGFEAHIGGCHVAILDGNIRLGFFTGNSPDFR